MALVTLDNLKTFLTQLNSRFATKASLATVATSGKYTDLTSTPIVDTALSSTSTNAIQNKAVNTELAKKAVIASPTFTGTVTAPTLTVTTTLNIPGGKIWIA